MLSPLSVISALSAVVLVVWFQSQIAWRTRTRGRPLPPGPHGLPVIGNLFNSPTKRLWIAYEELSARYGDIFHFRTFGQSTVVLASPDVINEFLDKRSIETSDRRQTALMKLLGLDISMSFMRYGARWRLYRRTFAPRFHPDKLVQHQPKQLATAYSFLRRLLDTPAELDEHIRYTFAATVLKVLYGIDPEEKDDPLIAAVESTMEGIGQGLVPGKFMVEHIPVLRHVPAWFPGAGWQNAFREWRAARDVMTNTPFERSMAAFVSFTALDETNEHRTDLVSGDQRTLRQNVASIAFEAAFLALSLAPDVVKKAHTELDAVVGPNRLPNFGDRDALVYVNAIALEALRWHTVVPIGVPHCTIADTELRGYFIPAGTAVIANIWCVLHARPRRFPDPYVFRPERFIREGKLDVGDRDPRHSCLYPSVVRICPGRHFAQAGLFLNFACVLHVFDISPPVDEHGNEIKIEPAVTDGFLSYPEDSRCTIKVRSPAAEALILEHTGCHGRS
ncbi:O-methylsterigmatocystin oxidoreductase [Epithele typhae]|uniref:O-methylsterigmatocystin oxidoreductase n=1 Tax=Epithele typhae TaxID=378194 RepID=UPI0020085D48|nr:O-methylsterigmatocystin oxidoreductase [Epithele typhae]KAH9929092.1 O-methylsterigmatocystin oxidoreductase [Epithele typhae]